MDDDHTQKNCRHVVGETAVLIPKKDHVDHAGNPRARSAGCGLAQRSHVVELVNLAVGTGKVRVKPKPWRNTLHRPPVELERQRAARFRLRGREIPADEMPA